MALRIERPLIVTILLVCVAAGEPAGRLFGCLLCGLIPSFGFAMFANALATLPFAPSGPLVAAY